MLPKLLPNKYLNAGAILILASASLHLLILFGRFVYSGNWYLINYFSMTELAIFFPFSLNNFWGNFAGVLLTPVLYFIFLALSRE